MSDFGAELERWMVTRGVGVRELHRRSGYSAGYITQLRQGRRNPSADAAGDLDDTLDAGGALLAAAQAPEPPSDAGLVRRPLEDDPADGMMSETLFNGWDAAVQRREFIAASAVLASSLAAPPQFASLSAGRRIGADVPRTLSLRLARLRRLDNYLGGGETYRLYSGELEATKTLAREAVCAQTTRQELLSVISEQAQQAGWAAFDAGWQATAQALYQESLDAACAAGNRALQGNALALLAYQSLTTGAPAASLAAASCVTAGSGAPPAVRALLHERRAWAIAHSPVHEAREARQALDTAAAALQEPSGEPAPDWAAWVDPIELRIMTGRCLTKLGRPREAIPVLQDALLQFDGTQARDKALYLSWLAEAHLDAGEIDAAAVTTRQILRLAAGVTSARPAQRITELTRRLSRHSAAPTIAAVLDEASTVMPTTWRG